MPTNAYPPQTISICGEAWISDFTIDFFFDLSGNRFKIYSKINNKPELISK